MAKKFQGNPGRFVQSVPSFIEGPGSKDVYQRIKSQGMPVDYVDGVMRGSSAYIAGSVQQHLGRQGFRVARLHELLSPQIYSEVKGKHYSHTNALLVRSEVGESHEHYEQIRTLLDAGLVLSRNSKEPALVRDLVYDEKSRLLIPGNPQELDAVFSDTFSLKYNQKKFSHLNENDIPQFNDKGPFTLWTSDAPLSGVCVGGNGGLYLDSPDLALSNDNGRVVVVRDFPEKLAA